MMVVGNISGSSRQLLVFSFCVYDQIYWEGGTVRVFGRHHHTPLRRTEGEERDGVRYHDGSLAIFQIVQDNFWYFHSVYDPIYWEGGTVRVFGHHHHTTPPLY